MVCGYWGLLRYAGFGLAWVCLVAWWFDRNVLTFRLICWYVFGGGFGCLCVLICGLLCVRSYGLVCFCCFGVARDFGGGWSGQFVGCC